MLWVVHDALYSAKNCGMEQGARQEKDCQKQTESEPSHEASSGMIIIYAHAAGRR
jgi:hypothetical protein